MNEIYIKETCLRQWKIYNRREISRLYQQIEFENTLIFYKYIDKYLFINIIYKYYKYIL